MMALTLTDIRFQAEVAVDYCTRLRQRHPLPWRRCFVRWARSKDFHWQDKARIYREAVRLRHQMG